MIFGFFGLFILLFLIAICGFVIISIVGLFVVLFFTIGLFLLRSISISVGLFVISIIVITILFCCCSCCSCCCYWYLYFYFYEMIDLSPTATSTMTSYSHDTYQTDSTKNSIPMTLEYSTLIYPIEIITYYLISYSIGIFSYFSTHTVLSVILDIYFSFSIMIIWIYCHS